MSRSAPGAGTAISTGSGSGSGATAVGGFVTLQFVAAAGLSLVLFVGCLNLLVFAYARGVVRAALDEGARAGARAAEPVGECTSRAEAVLDDLLGGPLGAGVEPVVCHASAQRVQATTRAVLPGWLPGTPAWRFEAAATVTREPGL